jgi:predicted RNA methylase
MNMMEAEVTRYKYYRKYVCLVDRCYYPEEQSVESLIDAISKQLDTFDRKVFEVLVNPPPGMISERNKSPDFVVEWRLASYFRVSRRRINDSKANIRKVVDGIFAN